MDPAAATAVATAAATTAEAVAAATAAGLRHRRTAQRSNRCEYEQPTPDTHLDPPRNQKHLNPRYANKTWCQGLKRFRTAATCFDGRVHGSGNGAERPLREDQVIFATKWAVPRRTAHFPHFSPADPNCFCLLLPTSIYFVPPYFAPTCTAAESHTGDVSIVRAWSSEMRDAFEPYCIW
ncbi:hypothetical protein GCM10009839_47900 [Catenulispora yoronensis]|uniref:Secreted protein n=1 Tax=Catenulispora yoronensis TaxID=450799 RepID=A0ABN2UU01_9ACTN